MSPADAGGRRRETAIKIFDTKQNSMIEIFSDPGTWASLATLTLMEVVLGIDNIVFISILAGKLPVEQQNRARLVGLGIACVTRLLLLMAVNWMAGLTQPLFHVAGYSVSGRDLILFGGGVFLIYKATKEIHEKLEGPDEAEGLARMKQVSFASVITQIVLLDIVFSLDSVITAIGMAEHLEVMMVAVVVALAFMIFVGKAIGNFVMQHPTVKMLALSFLLLIGVSLAAEAMPAELHVHIPKGYIYSAMAFSVFVEMLNIFVKKRKERKAVHLRRNVVGVDIGRRSSEG
jgi:predicted tellurium resistance membrane protein TerC